MGKHESKRHGTARSNKYKASMISVLLVLAMFSTLAMAEEWDISKGDVIVNNTDGTQTVTGVLDGQEAESTIEDSAPVIIQSDSSTATSNNITINTQGENVAEITIQNVNIATKNGIDVGSSNVEITISGEKNTIDASDSGIHVTDGSVVINGDGCLAIEASRGAAIGAVYSEDFSGDITINGGNLTLENDGRGAAIGTGQQGNVTEDASITINGGAIEASNSSSGTGAVIGSGQDGHMAGDITINGGTIEIQNGKSSRGAGIGAGQDGAMSGNITIGGDANVTTNGNSGAGIGSGQDGDVSGTITLKDNANVTSKSVAGSGIGTGIYGEFSGKISIEGWATVNASAAGKSNMSPTQCGPGIGSGRDGDFSGEVYIGGASNVTVSATPADDKIADVIGTGTGYPWSPYNRGEIKEDAKLILDKKATVNGTLVSEMSEEDIEGLFAGKIELVDEPLPSAPMPPAVSGTEGNVTTKYWVVEGRNAQWSLGSESGLAYELSHEGIIRVEIDGVEVEAEIDGVFVTISADVLEALGEGEHTIKFIYADGSASTALFVK